MMSESRATVGLKKVPIHLQSSQNRLCIKNGKIVNDDYITDADVYIEDGIIKQVGNNLLIPGGVKIIDAAGKMVIPGGIDTSTHLEMAFMGTKSCDDFYSGTKAALAGGTTMIIDYVKPCRGTSLLESYDNCRENADAKVCCDYGLHVIVPHFDAKVAADIAVLTKERGVNSFKAFMAYKDCLMLEDDQLYDLMKVCKENGALLEVHAENGKAIEKRADEVFANGITGPEGHVYSRPEEVEVEATKRAIVLADLTGCPLYMGNVTSMCAADEISTARREGKVVMGAASAAGVAVCGDKILNKSWSAAAAHVTSPPLRLDPATPAYLMHLLSSGDLACTGSAHCAYKTEQKALGKDDFRNIPAGVNGVEDRMSVIWEKGVETGILDASKFVAVTSTNAAKIFNLYPKKGRIAVGSDADLVIWNPKATRTISKEKHHQVLDSNIFEGMQCHGVPETVITGGKVVLDEGGLRVTQGAGSFVATPASCGFVYGRVAARENGRAALEKAVQREPYKGAVVAVDATPSRKLHPIEGDGASHSANGEAASEQKPAGVRTSVRTFHPPGGASNMPWM